MRISTVDHAKMKSNLMNGAVNVVAVHGLEGVTTKKISEVAGLNEAYIYRYFNDSLDLFYKAFMRVDDVLFGALEENIDILKDESIPYDVRYRRYFDKSWEIFIADPNVCKFYVRYYYSTYFTEEIRKEHQKVVIDYFDRVQPYFEKKLDHNVGLHQICSMFMCYAMDIADGTLPDNKETADMVFRVLNAIVDAFA